MSRFYKLEGKQAVPVSSLQEWVWWLVDTPFEDTIVASTQVDDTIVRTYFLGVNVSEDETPLLFETRVIDKSNCINYFDSTWDDAKQRHSAVVAELLQRTGGRA